MGQLACGADVDRGLAQTTISWREQSGDRIVYWGGLGHTVSALARTFPRCRDRPQRRQLPARAVQLPVRVDRSALSSWFTAVTAEGPPGNYIEAVLGAVGLK